MPNNRRNRRDFIRSTVAAGGLFAARDLFADERKKTAPNERLNIAAIGIGGRGAANVSGVAHENMVALCDVQSDVLANGLKTFPGAKGFADFREMFASVPNIDAVVISTPDHTHAVAAAAAMRLGKHVYCEKPLTHTVFETRTLRNLAKERKLTTQLGTQIHAGDNYRRVVEMVRGGSLGTISRVEVYFSGRPRVFPAKTIAEPPKSLAYDLWLGPTANEPYIKEQSHFNWRYWWKFGNGVLGDFGCHFMDLAFWALELGPPISVTSTGDKDHDGANDVPGKQRVDYVFAGKSGGPNINLTWRHGGDRPAETAKLDFGSGVLFIGSEGMLVADYGRYKWLPEEKFKSYRSITMPLSIGHHREWLEAIRNGRPTSCNFDYSGNLTEAVLLGNAAFRGAPGKALSWNAEKLQFTGDGATDVNKLLHREYRKGWTL